MSRGNIIALLVALFLGVVVGRYGVPDSIEESTISEEQQRKSRDKVTDTEKTTKKETITREIERPDGTKEKVTETREDTTVGRRTEVSEKEKGQKNVETSREVSYGSGFSISALAGASVTNTPFALVYGVAASKPVLGPISVGVFGLSSGVLGVSAGLTF